jgi:hypothetical protein
MHLGGSVACVWSEFYQAQKKDASLSGLALGCILGGDPIISRYEKMGAYLKRFAGYKWIC